VLGPNAPGTAAQAPFAAADHVGYARSNAAPSPPIGAVRLKPDLSAVVAPVSALSAVAASPALAETFPDTNAAFPGAAPPAIGA
jgi:hypothetical protein